MRASTIKALLLAVALAAVGVLLRRWGHLEGLDDHELATRLLESRGIACTPKIVDRREGELYVVCADGKYDLVSPLPCGTSSPILCDVLGIDAACWELVRD